MSIPIVFNRFKPVNRMTRNWRERRNNPVESRLSTVSMIEGGMMTTWRQPFFSNGEVVYRIKIQNPLADPSFEHNLSLELLEALDGDDGYQFTEIRF